MPSSWPLVHMVGELSLGQEISAALKKGTAKGLSVFLLVVFVVRFGSGQ